jgi:hypothetical protein
VCAVWPHCFAPVQLTTPTSTYGQTQLACPSHGSLFAAAPLHARALPSLYRHAEPSSPSLSPCAGPRCPHAMHGYKTRSPLCLIRTRAMSAFGKPSPPHPPLFSTTPSVLSRLTRLPSSCAGPRASPEPRAAPQPEGPAPSPPLSSNAVDRAGEFCPSVACLPRCELGLSIMPGECTVG